MSVTLICPNCSRPAVYHYGVIPTGAACGSCGELFPEELRRAAADQLAIQLVPRPIALTIGMILANIWGTLWGLALILAPFGPITYSINGEVVSGKEFLSQAGINLGVMAAVSLGIAYGIWKEKTWSRHLIVFFWAVMFVIEVLPIFRVSAPEAIVLEIPAWATGTALSIWYLYGKPNVKAYYKRLEGQKTETR